MKEVHLIMIDPISINMYLYRILYSHYFSIKYHIKYG